MKRFILLLFIGLSAISASANEPAEVQQSAKVARAPHVTYDVIGTFAANAPVSRSTAPNAAFLLDFTVPETTSTAAQPNTHLYFNAPILCGSYSFEGRTYRSNAQSGFGYTASGGNATDFGISTPEGYIGFAYQSGGAGLFSWVVQNQVVRFVIGDLGTASLAHTDVYFTSEKGKQTVTSNVVKFTDVVGRLTP